MKTKLFLFIVALFPLISSAQWQQTQGPFGGQINCLAITGSTIFAGSDGGNIYKTVNNGTDWTYAGNGITNAYIHTIVTRNDTLFTSSGRTIYRSVNNGNSWQIICNGLGAPVYSYGANTLLLKDDKVLAGTNDGVFLSTDQGASWTWVNNGLPTFICVISSLASNGNYVFAGGNGVYRTSDYGANWIDSYNGMGYQNVNALAVCNNYIFAATDTGGVYVSNNNGTSWTVANNGLTAGGLGMQCYSLHVNGNNVYVGTNSGLYVTVNHGLNWTLISNSTCQGQFLSILHHNNQIFAGVGKEGIYRTSDYGLNWMAVNNGLKCSKVYSLATSNNHTYAGTWSLGIFKTNYLDSVWRAVNTGINYHGDIINTLVINEGDVLAGTNFNGIIKKNLNDTIWNSLNNGLIYPQVHSIILNNSLIFLGAGNVYKSDNNGLSWATANNGFASVYPDVRSLYINRWGTLFASTYGGDGFYMSANNGASWTSINNTVEYSYSIAATDSFVFWGTVNKIYRCDNNGANWAICNNGFPTTQPPAAFSLKSVGNNLFAGTNHGIYLTTDNGLNWISVDTGMIKTYYCWDLSIRDNYLLAATDGAGVWKRLLSEMVSSIGIEEQNLSGVRIYPNPTTEYLQIDMVPSNTFITLFDFKGQKLLSRKVSESATLDITNLTQGIYLLKIQNTNDCQVLKFLKQ